MHYGKLRMAVEALTLIILIATSVPAWAALTIDPLSSPSTNTNVAVTGTCAEGATVTLDVPGAVVGPVSYPSPTGWRAAVSALTDGDHTITATSDMDEPASVSVELYVDANAPVLTVSTLPSGAVTNVSLLNIAGSATDAASGLALVTINGEAVELQPDGRFSGVVTLVSGSNDIAVAATDRLGNSTTDNRVIRLDLTAPHLAITSPADNTVTSQAVATVTGTVDEESVVAVALGAGGGEAAEQNGTSFSADLTLQPGLNTITVTATDLAGNSTVAKRSVLYDSSIPSLQVTQPPQDQATNNRIPVIAGSASDPDSAVQVTIAAGGQTHSPPLEGGSFSQQLSLGGDGSYPVTVTCQDQAGNKATVVRTLLLDTTSPAIAMVTTTAAQGRYGEGTQLPLTLSFSEPVSGEGLTLVLSSGGSARCGALAGVASCTAVYTVAFGENSEKLEVTQVSGTISDSAGNRAIDPTVSAAANLSASKILVIDTGAPTATIASHPTDPTSQQSAAFAFTSDEAGSGFECSLDAGQYATCSTPVVLDLTGRPNGRHTFAVRAVDLTGNVGAPASWSWTIDTIPPAVTVAPAQTRSGSYLQTATATDASAVSVQWSMVEGSGKITFSAPSSLQTDVTATADGGYVLRLTATDAAGNSAYASTSLVWDTTLPEVSAGAGRTAGSAFTQTGSASDATATTLSWSKASGPGTVSFGSPASAGTTVSMDKDGSYVLRLTATDAAGNSASSDAAVVWDTTPPSVTAGTSRTANTTFTQTGSVTDGTATTLSWSKVSGPGTVSFGSPASAGTTVTMDQDGSYVLRLTATDAAGNSASADVTLIWDTTLPAVNAGAPRTANRAFTQTGSVSDATASTLSWSKTSGPGTVTFGSSASASTTVSMDQDGSYVLRLTAMDGSGNTAYGEVTIVWDTTLPTVSAGAGRTAGSAFTQTGSASDATATTLSWSKASGPGTVSFGSPASAGTTVSMDKDGSYVLRLTAVDGAGNSSTSDVAVVWDTTAPTLIQPPPVSTAASVNLKVQVSDATSLTYQWQQLSGPGTVTLGQPVSPTTSASADLDGVYLLRFTATDAAGNSSATEASLTWDTTAPQVAAGGSRVVNAPFTPAATASDATPLNYRWEQLSGPGNITFSDATALVPQISATADGSYSLRLTATDAAGNSSSDTLALLWTTQLPLVSAGPSSAHNASYTQYGFSSGTTQLTFKWSQASGPGTVSFGSPDALATTVSADQQGTYLLRLTSTDLAGNVSSSDASLIWDLDPPALSVDLPPDHGYTSLQQLAVSGKVVDSLSGIQSLQLNGASLALDTDGNFSQTVQLSTGTNVITVVAIDQAGNAIHSTSSVILDQAVPVISLTAPATNEFKTNKPQLMITGSVDHDCVLTIHVSGPAGTRDFTASPLAGTLFSQLVDNLAVGVTTIRLTATTQANLSSTRVITVTYQTEAPTLTLTSPQGDVRPGQNTLVVAGTATDKMTAVKVTISVNGQFYTPAVVGGTFSQSVPLTVKGLYPVTVTATNEAGSATVATRRVIYATPTGDLNADGKTDISDALLALQVSVGMRPQLDGFLVLGDMAPLVDNVPVPDWIIDIGDAVLILRVIVGSLAQPT